MKTITENVNVLFFFVKNALQSACGWMKMEVFENDYVQCTRSLQIKPSGCGDKNGHEIIYRFRLVGPKAIQNWLNFWAGIFFKKRTKSPNLCFPKCGLGLSRENILNEIMILLL